MFIQQININLLYIFVTVFRSKNMTAAAEKLNITQSGVSQHIKNLEEIIETPLFDRVGKNIVPTRKAKDLFQKWSKAFQEIENTLSELKTEEFQLSGRIHIGCPIEFGNHFVLPKVALFLQKHPLIDLKVFYGHTSEMQEMIKKGELDFAFFDGFETDKSISLTPVYEETLELCVSKKYLQDKKLKTVQYKKDYFERLDFVTYLEDAPIVTQWFKHHFKGKKLDLRIRSSSMDVQGVETLIRANLGAGILPVFRINSRPELKKDLHIFKGPKGKVKNMISLAYLREKRLDLACTELIKDLQNQFSSISRTT